MPTAKFFAGCLRDIATLVREGQGKHVSSFTIEEAADALDPPDDNRPNGAVKGLRDLASWLLADGHDMLAASADDLAASLAEAYHVDEDKP